MNHLFNKWSVPCALRQVPAEAVDEKAWDGSGLFKNCNSFFSTKGIVFGSKCFDLHWLGCLALPNDDVSHSSTLVNWGWICIMELGCKVFSTWVRLLALNNQPQWWQAVDPACQAGTSGCWKAGLTSFLASDRVKCTSVNCWSWRDCLSCLHAPRFGTCTGSEIFVNPSKQFHCGNNSFFFDWQRCWGITRQILAQLVERQTEKFPITRCSFLAHPTGWELVTKTGSPHKMWMLHVSSRIRTKQTVSQIDSALNSSWAMLSIASIKPSAERNPKHSAVDV